MGREGQAQHSVSSVGVGVRVHDAADSGRSLSQNFQIRQG